MSWQFGIVFALAGSVVIWAGSRYCYFVSAATSRRTVTTSEKLGILVFSLATFPIWLAILIWPGPFNFAAGSILRWVLVATPFFFFYYPLYYFWKWRREKLIQHGRYQPVKYVLKPQSFFGWVVYIYGALFFTWQAVHWLAPSWLPNWIR